MIRDEAKFKFLYRLDRSQYPPRPVPIHRLEELPTESDRIICEYNAYGMILISTVFLPISIGLYSTYPIVFETMVFSSLKIPEYQLRYENYLDAMDGHALIVEHVKKFYWIAIFSDMDETVWDLSIITVLLATFLLELQLLSAS